MVAVNITVCNSIHYSSSSFPPAYLSILVPRGESLHERNLSLCIVSVRLQIGRRQVLEDFLHLGLESHVEHSICFVQNDIGALGQLHVAILEHIQQTAGRGDHDLQAEGYTSWLIEEFRNTQFVQCTT